MSGSKTNRFFSQLADKLLGPQFDTRQPYSPYYPGDPQFAAPQYGTSQYTASTFNPEQYLKEQTTTFSGARAAGHSRQHVGHAFHGDDRRTHASDQAQLYNGNVHYANTYIYYQSEAADVARASQTSSAPPATDAAPPANSRPPPNLPPRQDGAASEPPSQVNLPPPPQGPPPAGTQDWSKVIHLACCDNCGKNPLRGLRWKCNSCPDHDICADCKNSGGDEGHTFYSLPSLQRRPLQLASLGQAASAGSRYGVMSQLIPGAMIEMCETPRLDPLVLAARAGHFQVCQELMEKVGLVYPPQCISAAIKSAHTAPGPMGKLLAMYLENQAQVIEQQKQQTLGVF